MPDSKVKTARNQQLTVTLTPEVVARLKALYVDTGQFRSVPAAIRYIVTQVVDR